MKDRTEYYKKYYQEHKKEAAEYARKYREKNRDALNAYNRQYHKEHKEEISNRKKKYLEENKHWIYPKRRERYYSDPEYRAKILDRSKGEDKNRHRYLTYQKKYWKYKTGFSSQKVAEALKSGKLIRQPCEICGDSPAQAHHDDYNKPLEVRWLCRKCHTEWHMNNSPIYIKEVG